jgi:hypothetical protein
MTGFCVVAFAAAPSGEVWLFDQLDEVGGHKTLLVGRPHLIHTSAVEFNGIDDAIFLDVHPLAGAETFTWEVVFRPDSGGAPEQRFFHLQENGTDNRMLFEIRVVDGQWCLDSFVKSGAGSRALLDRSKVHPLGAWYSVAAVYDGTQFSNYVDGVLEGSAELHLPPQKPGRTSVGVRINGVSYFKGAVLSARMTPRALDPAEFLKKP